LVYDPIREQFSLFMIQPDGSFTQLSLTKNDLRILLLNHIAIDQPKGIATKEFVPNLAGNYIIFHQDGEVSGTDVTTFGYQGEESAPNYPGKISQGTENGETYEIDNWFSYIATNLYNAIQTSYPVFYNHMKRAGLVLEREYRFTFISNNEFYTVFIPSDDALNASDISSLSGEALRQRIFLHFIQGQIIFTDGNKDAGYYETLRSDSPSSQYASDFTRIYIEPGIDIIKIKSKEGTDFTEIIESELANRLSGIIVSDDDTQVFTNVFTNVVIHEIDKVLSPDELDTD